MRVFILLLWGVALFGSAVAARADVTGADALRVFVVTIGPGGEAWEKFGHNAVLIHDPAAPLLDQQDVDYNWGYFDFNQKNFYARFIQGRMLYEMRGEPMAGTVAMYRESNRSIHLQELNLAPAAKAQLLQTLRAMDTDANRYYRYDYYRDNCSTRVRDVIDGLTGGRLGAATKAVPSGSTFRFHTRRLTAGTPWLYTVLQGVLGHPVDEPISQWDEMFLPEKLHERLRGITVPDPAGSAGSVPLVRQEWPLFEARRPAEPAAPPNAVPWFMGAGIGVSGLLLGLGHFVRRHRAARAAFVAAVVPWLLFMGAGGAIILWGWAFTDHAVARRNENLMHVSPLMLPLAVLLPLLVFGRRRGAGVTRALAVAAGGVSVLGLILKVFPAFRQVNLDVIALTLPVNVSVAFVAWKLAGPLLKPAAAPAGVPVRTAMKSS